MSVENGTKSKAGHVLIALEKLIDMCYSNNQQQWSYHLEIDSVQGSKWELRFNKPFSFFA